MAISLSTPTYGAGRIASPKSLPNKDGCLKYEVTGKSNLRNWACVNQTGYQNAR